MLSIAVLLVKKFQEPLRASVLILLTLGSLPIMVVFCLLEVPEARFVPVQEGLKSNFLLLTKILRET